MTRTKLCDRVLPNYTKGEELFNTLSHSAGAVFGIVALLTCLMASIAKQNIWGIVSSIIYGGSLILLYTMSSVYHGLPKGMAKKVLQVIDHCTIYFMIAGTYTPYTLCTLREEVSPFVGWGIFGLVWGIAALAVTLTAIDLKKYSKFSMICYLGMGWCILLTVIPLFRALGFWGSAFLLGGGILYTIGAIFYGFGRKKRYIHSVFHIFVVLASVLHFFSIFFYVI